MKPRFNTAIVLLIVTGCLSGAIASPAAVYHVRGIFRSFDPGTHEAVISHETIPGYMSAMTMAFRVADDSEVRGLRVGASLSLALHVTANDAWIDQIQQVSAQTFGPFPQAKISAATELKAGDRWPDAMLTDERGATVYLHDFRGKPLALTFIYLGCPLPTYCPLTNHNFQSAQTILQRLKYDGLVRLLTISMDPSHDTPERLAAVALGYAAKPPLWSFASVSQQQLRPMASAADLQFSQLNGQIVHNLRTVVLDSDGRVRRIFRGNSWTPQELVAELRAALQEPSPQAERPAGRE